MTMSTLSYVLPHTCKLDFVVITDASESVTVKKKPWDCLGGD